MVEIHSLLLIVHIESVFKFTLQGCAVHTDLEAQPIELIVLQVSLIKIASLMADSAEPVKLAVLEVALLNL